MNARATRVSGQDPPLDIRIRLDIEDAKRGDPILGTVEKALGAANAAVAKVLETRRY
jgi:hypothetical protein